jgi:hypothetical protein
VSAVTKTVTVTVTQKDINIGTPLMCYLCPVALAISRAVGGRRVRVKNPYRWGFSDGPFGDKRDNEPDARALPLIARTFIEAFDLGKPVGPFSFELEVPI